MVEKTGHHQSARGFYYKRGLFLLSLLVGLSTLYLWQKFELARVSTQIFAAQSQISELEKEGTKLRAEIGIRKKPGLIRKIVENRLGMINATNQLIELRVGDGEVK